MKTRDLLLEIGTEEIPARFIAQAVTQIETLTIQALRDKSLSYDRLKVYATPRRFALLVTGLAELQPDTVVEAKGPAVKSAYDPDGNATKALLGFCKGQGVEEKDLLQKEVGGNLYVFAKKNCKGLPAEQVLPDLLVFMVHKLYFPKMMRWGYEEMRFVRPIRWLVALWGEDVLPLQLADKTSGRVTRGHRVLGSDAIVLDSPAQYEEKLMQNYVIVDQAKRRELIWQQIWDVASKNGGYVEKDEELLGEVVYLVEYPTALSGGFDKKYLEIPKELVITPMREHQRYFPLYKDSSKQELLPKFITVRNGDDRSLQLVSAGNESVLRARLKDAEFFWQEDCKLNLEECVERLSKVVYHEKLGTSRAKVARVQKLAIYLAQKLGLDPSQLKKVERAALLMKADLVSHAVYEFTELQGIMGEYYCRNAKEDEEVSQAVREHYQPRFAGDDLPQTTVGKVAGIADKLDSLVGFFAIAMQPTGSQDPYALRRAASGITLVVLRNSLHLSISDLIAFSYDLIAQDTPLSRSKQETIDSVSQFMKLRLENILSEENISYDVINAVSNTSADDLFDTYRRAYALDEYKGQANCTALLAGFKRASNMVRNAEAKGELADKIHVTEKLLADDAEKNLYVRVNQTKGLVEKALAAKDYIAALTAIGSLREVIDRFFDDVMVMSEDVAVRNNRLALLRQIVDLPKNIGDLSQIV